MFGFGAPTKNNKDFSIPDGTWPSDTISCLDMTPSIKIDHEILSATSWDGTIKLWEASHQGESALVHTFQDSRPLLCTCFSTQKEICFGGLNNEVKLIQIDTLWNNLSSTTVVAKHDKPVKAVKCIPECQFPYSNLVVSGSWDGTVKFSDKRLPPEKTVHKIDFSAKIISMDVSHGYMVVATTNRNVRIYDLRGVEPRLVDDSSNQLDHQYTDVSILSDEVYAIGSVEGRTAIKYFNQPQKSYAFKCHRQDENNGHKSAYPVTGIAKHPFETFATVGGDGDFVFWDYKARSRLKKCSLNGNIENNTITCCSFNTTGNLFAYAVGYDWSLGPKKDTSEGNCIYFHICEESEIQPKDKKLNRRRH